MVPSPFMSTPYSDAFYTYFTVIILFAEICLGKTIYLLTYQNAFHKKNKAVPFSNQLLLITTPIFKD